MIAIGQLTRRMKFFTWQDVPHGDYDTEQNFEQRGEVWCSIVAIVGAAYRDGVQTLDEVTHRVVVRHNDGLTDAHSMSRMTEVEIDSIRYRIKRVNDWQDKRRFTVIEVLEIKGT